MNISWTCLIIAGLFEIGWPVGLKNGWTSEGMNVPWTIFAFACIVISGALLLYAQRSIPLGTSYAVWTGIGAAGTFVIGAIYYGDPVSTVRVLSILSIIAGVAGLRLA